MARIEVLNEHMNTVLLATSHISGTGIAEIILALAVIASLLLFVVVDPSRDLSRRKLVEGKVEREDVDANRRALARRR